MQEALWKDERPVSGFKSNLKYLRTLMFFVESTKGSVVPSGRA